LTGSPARELRAFLLLEFFDHFCRRPAGLSGAGIRENPVALTTTPGGEGAIVKHSRTLDMANFIHKTLPASRDFSPAIRRIEWRGSEVTAVIDVNRCFTAQTLPLSASPFPS